VERGGPSMGDIQGGGETLMAGISSWWGSLWVQLGKKKIYKGDSGRGK